MSRLSGEEFDNQWNHSRRVGKARAARGEGPWAVDKALERQPHTPSGPKHAKPSSDSCLAALGVLGGIGWALSELAGKALS